jgi:hypothetical protein
MTGGAVHGRRAAGGRSSARPASVWLRLRVCLRRRALDAQIAAGQPLGLSPVLLLRAAQLTHPGTRRRVARGLRRLVDYAERVGPRPIVSRSVLGRTGVSVMADREALLGLADRLERPPAVSPRGVLLARGLLRSELRDELVDPHLGSSIACRVWEVADILVWASAAACAADHAAD